ncbi:MAG: VCBS repeat-containing protein [Deltaproteobacteria bacterium]|nr:VCBS repeat-containing protein [Deltaproteobacteria bacterium]MCW5802910.1 VCBS repeat-containing protein [Deltaproteobacteria bacterium]
MRAPFVLGLLGAAGCSNLLGITDPSTKSDDGSPPPMIDAEVDSAIDAPPPCTAPTAFGAEASFDVEPGATGLSLALGKLDAGATLDVAIAIGTDVVILHGDGTGVFANPTKLGSVAGQVLIDDFDTDARDDLILVQVGGSKVAIRRQSPAGTFLAEQPLAGPFTNLHRALVGQLDGNVRPDLYIEDDVERRIWTSGALTPGSFLRENTTIGVAGDQLLSIEQIDRAQRDETVLVDGSGNVKLSINSTAAPKTIATGATGRGAAFGKFNGDMFPDLVIATAAGGVLFFQDPANPGTFVMQAGLIPEVTGDSLQVLDVNGDGTDDIITPTRIVLQCPGAPATFTQVEGFNAKQPSLFADVNGNGKPDLLRLEGGTLKVRLQ